MGVAKDFGRIDAGLGVLVEHIEMLGGRRVTGAYSAHVQVEVFEFAGDFVLFWWDHENDSWSVFGRVGCSENLESACRAVDFLAGVDCEEV